MRAPRVLLVDDEIRVVEALQRSLHDAPFDVGVATSGEDALRELGQRPIDVIISDEQMPDLLGTDLLATVRERSPRTMRVMLTGDVRLESAVRAINVAGVFRYLRKPCDAEDLRRCIDDALRAAPGAAAYQSLEPALAQLWIAAQPIVSPGDQRIHAYELLVRSRSRDLPHPGALFEAAERCDRVADLEGRILELAGDVALRAPEGSLVFVNLHPSTLHRPSLLDPLQAAASRVVLEITERAGLSDAMLDCVAELRGRGFRIAVDDLGAGYAGLTYVAKMRPDVVKLDMGLVQGITESRVHATLVSAMIVACQTLGISVVGEGVETTGTRDKLIELGCELQQGYLYARPAAPFCAASW